MEWGCMQALIDYDGWRKWKAFAQTKEEADGPKKSTKPKKTKKRLSITAPA
jgi:osomolarity two-component system response regulator SSK1